MFPISRDPPEGGTLTILQLMTDQIYQRFQFLGIPPKGEQPLQILPEGRHDDGFQFLGIPPKGEREVDEDEALAELKVSNF